MSRQFNEYLKGVRVSSKDDYSNGSIEPMGKYRISNDEYEDFLIHYQNELIKSIKKQKAAAGEDEEVYFTTNLTFTERPPAYAPLRFDFDFVMADDIRPYTKDDIIQVLEVINRVLDEVRDKNTEEKVKNVVVLEKPVPRENPNSKNDTDAYKDGFHLHYPFFIIEPWAEKQIKERVDEILESENTLGHIQAEITNDRDMASKMWLMYGSSKESGGYFYQVTFCMTSELEEVTFEEIFEEELEETKVPKKYYYLPRLLSIRGRSGEGSSYITPLDQEFSKKKSQRRIVMNQRISRKDDERSDSKIMEELKEIREFQYLEHLSQDRADDYHKWMEVGWTLYCISAGMQEGLDLWIEFSKRSDKFEDGKCEELWNKMQMRGRTMGSLIYMLRQDNPEYWKKIRETDVKSKIADAVFKKPTDVAVAKILYAEMRRSFVYTSLKRWYCFGTTTAWGDYQDQKYHYWKKMTDETEFRLYIMEDLCDKFKNYLTYIKKEKPYSGETSEIFKKQEIKNCLEMIEKLETGAFVDKVIRTCRSYFFDSKFEMKRDQNPWLLACENGVLDLKNKIFREGYPDDYITLSTEIYYDPNPDIKEIQKVDYILGKIFVDKEHLHFVKKMCATTLYGRNLGKWVPIHHGPTNRGKSVLISFMRACLGKYAKELKKEKLLANARQSSGGPDIEMKRNKGIRLLIAPEMRKEDVLDIGTIKQQSGQTDRIYARDHHDSEGEDMVITWTLWLQFNEWPKVPGDDEAFWGRVLAILYLSTFVKPEKLKDTPVPKTDAEQYAKRLFRANLKLDIEIERLAPVFLHMLFKLWNEEVSYFEDDPSIMEPPKLYKESLKQKRSEFDILSKFIFRSLEKYEPEFKGETPTKKEIREHFISATSLFKRFNDWFDESYKGMKNNMSIFRFTEAIEKAFGVSSIDLGEKTGFVNVRLKPQDDSEDDSEGEESEGGVNDQE